MSASDVVNNRLTFASTDSSIRYIVKCRICHVMFHNIKPSGDFSTMGLDGVILKNLPYRGTYNVTSLDFRVKLNDGTFTYMPMTVTTNLSSYPNGSILRTNQLTSLASDAVIVGSMSYPVADDWSPT